MKTLIALFITHFAVVALASWLFGFLSVLFIFVALNAFFIGRIVEMKVQSRRSDDVHKRHMNELNRILNSLKEIQYDRP